MLTVIVVVAGLSFVVPTQMLRWLLMLIQRRPAEDRCVFWNCKADSGIATGSASLTPATMLAINTIIYNIEWIKLLSFSLVTAVR